MAGPLRIFGTTILTDKLTRNLSHKKIIAGFNDKMVL
jgi:hypothetical protein